MTNPNFEKLYKKVVGGDRLELDSYLAEKVVNAVVEDLTGLMDQCIEDIYALEPSERPLGYISQLQDWIDTFKAHYK